MKPFTQNLGASTALRAVDRAIRSNLFACGKKYFRFYRLRGRKAALPTLSGIRAAASMPFLLLGFRVRETPHLANSRHPWRPVPLTLALALLASCVTPPTTPAPWAEAPQSLRRMFPDGEYIAQRGRGKTRAAAEAAAALEIARYITSQVSGTQGYRMTSTEINGRGAEKTETVNEARVKTEIDLFGIRYADGAFYDAARREWHAAAYIEREEAWQVYKPRVQTQADSFLKLYNAAETEDDAFKKVMRYEAARAYTAKDEFTNAFIFGQILSPANMNRDYAAVRATASALPQKIDNARRGATVYIDCNPDFEERVTQALSEWFRAQGYAVSKTRSGAAAVCEVTVSEGEQKRELGVFYHPSLRAELRGKSGVLASFTVQGERAQAVTPDVAKRRAYTSLAEAVRKVQLSVASGQ